VDVNGEIPDNRSVEELFTRGPTPKSRISDNGRRNHLLPIGSLKIKIETNSGRFSQILVMQAAQVQNGDNLS